VARTAVDDQIRTRIDAFVEEISGLVRKAAVEAVQEALQGSGSAPSSAAPRRGRKPGPKPGRKPGPRKATRKPASGKRIRRSAADLERMGAALLDQVRKNPGSRMEEISAALGEDTKDLRRPVQMLVDAGQLRTQGQKRATQYYAGAGKPRATGKKRAAKKTRKKATRKKARSKAR
jgi:hypothetical protein